MKIQTSINEDSLLISLVGQLNSSSSHELESIIRTIPNGICEITFDMKELTYITSAGLRVLIMAGKKVGDGNLYISNMNDDVKDILKMTGIIDLVRIRNDVAPTNQKGFLLDFD